MSRKSETWCPQMAVLLAGVFALCTAVSAQTTQPAGPHRIYSRLLDPREHPDYTRRHVRPPTWETFGGRTRFTSLRGFALKDGKLVGFKEELDRYTKKYDLGEVIWPWIGVMFASNLDELADEIKRRDLFLFDVWGYVPGSGPGGDWQEYRPPASAFRTLESKLGEHWLGMDNGEQDGRYIGGYAPQMTPASAGRIEQYLNFQRHFERMCEELGNRMCTLVSLNYGHYFLKEGVYTLIGAETAQALPNAQIYYAFIRGAGKQYGVPWFGNASVWNRWGWKSYGPAGPDHGPTMGTSLSLLKRLMYSHILYNCVAVGFESGFLDGDALTPIGRIQQAAQRWVRANGQPGVMITPIAVMTDFFAGWTFPRHLYTDRVYRVWGNLPYGPGDYLTDNVLDMLYPGYVNSSYYHDESGFIAPTPYGDAADCLLSDAPGWLLARYPLLVVAGELSGGAEIRDKLAAYVEGGGRLVITAGNLAKWSSGLGGIAVTGPPVDVAAGAVVRVGAETIKEDRAFCLYPLSIPGNASVPADTQRMPAAVAVFVGKGQIVVLAAPFGIVSRAAGGPITNEVDKPLARPFPMLKHVRALLERELREQMLFDAGPELSLIACRKGPGEYTLGVCNNSWRQQPLKITSHCGAIEAVRELPLDQSQTHAAGYVPAGIEKADLGASGPDAIAGGDVRVFAVHVRERGVEEIPHVPPPGRPPGRLLPSRGLRTIKEEVLTRPTFFEHFDGVVVDWRYLQRSDVEALRQEAGWIGRQGLRLWIDLSSGVNLYPDLRLVNNDRAEYEASMKTIESLPEKMQALGARDLILPLHRVPENNITADATMTLFVETLRHLCRQARPPGIALHLRTSADKPPWNVTEAVQFIRRVGEPNLDLAVNTGWLLAQNADMNALGGILKDKVGVWLLAGTRRDAAGRIWDYYAPIAGSPEAARLALDARPRAACQGLADLLAIAPDRPVILDAIYGDEDAEYHDARLLAELASCLPTTTSPATRADAAADQGPSP
jgi:hypothetical protein